MSELAIEEVKMSEELDMEEVKEAAEDLRSVCMKMGYHSGDVESISQLLEVSLDIAERFESLRESLSDVSGSLLKLSNTVSRYIVPELEEVCKDISNVGEDIQESADNA